MTRCVLLNLTVELDYCVDPPRQYGQLGLETRKRNKDMALTLPELPYARDALAPHMSAETPDYHYGKHHTAYVDNGNKLFAGTEFENMSIDAFITKSSGQKLGSESFRERVCKCV